MREQSERAVRGTSIGHVLYVADVASIYRTTPFVSFAEARRPRDQTAAFRELVKPTRVCEKVLLVASSSPVNASAISTTHHDAPWHRRSRWCWTRREPASGSPPSTRTSPRTVIWWRSPRLVARDAAGAFATRLSRPRRRKCRFDRSGERYIARCASPRLTLHLAPRLPLFDPQM